MCGLFSGRTTKRGGGKPPTNQRKKKKTFIDEIMNHQGPGGPDLSGSTPKKTLIFYDFRNL